jgi:predicted nucleic acid-binding protein
MLLLDAGVWVAARDPDDRFHVAAREIVLDFSRPVAALDLTFYEIANVMGSRKKQLGEARYLLRTLETRCGDDIVAAGSQSVDSVLDIALEHDLTAYDADLVSQGLAVAPDGSDYP